MLITRHLQFSLPYRALFSHTLRPETMNRLLDALAALLVRMHLTGFFWGDCSLSNTLFRRDAGAFAAYLVDAETGALHPKLSEGQRSEDLEIARVNIFGEALDLQAAELLHEAIDPETVADEVVPRYERLWHEVTYEQQVARDARHDIEGRIRRLNELGFDVAEVAMSTGGRRRLPGAPEGGRRRLPHPAAAAADRPGRRGEPGPAAAQRPGHLPGGERPDRRAAGRAPLADRGLRAGGPGGAGAPAPQARAARSSSSQIIEHRWRLSEKAGRDVGLAPAVQSFLADVLVHRPDEQAVLGVEVGRASSAPRTACGRVWLAAAAAVPLCSQRSQRAGPARRATTIRRSPAVEHARPRGGCPDRPRLRPNADQADHPYAAGPVRLRDRRAVQRRAGRAPAPPRPAARAGRPGWWRSRRAPVICAANAGAAR